MHKKNITSAQQADLARLVVIIPLLCLVNFFSGCFVNTFFKDTHSSPSTSGKARQDGTAVASSKEPVNSNTAIIADIHTNGNKATILPGTSFRHKGYIYFALDKGLYIRHEPVAMADSKNLLTVKGRFNNKIM